MGLRRELECSIQGLNVKPEMKSERLLLPCWQEDKGPRSDGEGSVGTNGEARVLWEHLGALGTPVPGRRLLQVKIRLQLPAH